MSVNASNHRVRQSGAVDISADKSAVGFELGVEFLQESRGDLIQRMVSDFGNDLFVDALLVGGLGGFLQRVLAVGLIPEVHPLAKGHGRRGFLCDRPQLGLELFELFKALCLCFSGHVFGLRHTFFIVADYDASLPSAVLALAQRSFACFSALCHGFNSFPRMSVI